jgi:putative protein-disulfide isomerase
MKLKLIITLIVLTTIKLIAQDKCPIKPAKLLVANNAERQQLINTSFPTIPLKNLKKQYNSLPQICKGKANIVCILFTDRGRPIANPWTEAILKKYNTKDVNLVELAMLGGGLKILRSTIENGMRKEVDSSFHNSYNTFFGKTKVYKKQLFMKDKNSCYIFLLDKAGVIQYTTDGYMDEEKMKLLTQKIEDINASKIVAPNPLAKDTIRFVFDPLCGFCYAFEPELKKVVDAYSSKFVFDIIAGGMVIGEQEGPISKVAPHIAYGYKDLEKMSTSKFGDKFLNGILKEGTYKMSSEMPCIAVTVFKSLQPNNAIAFANDVQKLLYFDGTSLNEPQNYKALAIKYDLNADDFILKLTQPEWKTKTYAQFTQAEKLGVEGYPALTLERNGSEQIVVNGFESFKNMIKMYPFNK